MNYSLLVMESSGMMKMGTGEGFPPSAGCQNGSRLVLGGYRGFWRRNSRSILRSGSFRSCGYIWVQEVRQGSHEGPTRQGARPPPSWTPRDSSSPTLLLRGLLSIHKNHQKLARQLDSVWYSFSVKLKNKGKQKLTLGSRLIG